MLGRALTLALLGLTATMSATLRAHAHDVESVIVLPAPEARGCYFDRGHMFCARYCYWEVNGKRYCRTHARHAYAQGGLYVEPLRPHRRAIRHHRHRQHQTIK